MNKILLALALLTSVSFAQSSSTQSTGIYLGAGAGIMAINDKEGDFGLAMSLRGGMALNHILKGFGVQIELNNSLIDPETRNNIDIDVMTMALYTTYDISIPNSGVKLRPKIGAILPNMKDDIDSRDLILSSGFGMTYGLRKDLRLYADYTVLGSGVSNYSAGLEFKF